MRVLLLAILSTLAACAAAPPAPAPAASADVAPVAAANSPAPAVAGDASDDEFEPPAGYKARVENGQTTYCRKVTVLGSRFPKDVCMTEAQLREQEANNAAFGRDKDQASRVCAGGGACQGT